MASLAEKVYMDLMARGKDIETARRWRHLTMKFEVCCGTKRKYDRDDVIRYLSCLREHIHVICKGVFMPQRELEPMWISVPRSIKPYIEAVDDVAGAARYMGGYLNMQSYRVRKYIMSADWVFPGWVSWSKWFKRNWGVYPDKMYPGILAKLARMSKRERDEIIIPELMKMEGLW